MNGSNDNSYCCSSYISTILNGETLNGSNLVSTSYPHLDGDGYRL